MDQINQDSPLERLSNINPTSPHADDSFLKSPFNSETKSIAKIEVKSNSTIEGSFRDVLKRMQDEMDILLHENAELKSRRSVYASYQNTRNRYNNKDVDRFEADNKNIDNSSKIEKGSEEDSYKKDVINILKVSLVEKDALIESLSEKVDGFSDKIQKLEKENRILEIEVRKRDNYLQQKLQLEIDIKESIRSNQELKTKLYDLENQMNLMHISNQSSFLQENSEIVEDPKNEIMKVCESIIGKDKMAEIKEVGHIKESRRELELKDKEIQKLGKENKLSKDVNQTLVKLLKLKNLQIQATKILSKKEDQISCDIAKSNLEKFENEERKLLRVLEVKMKQYGELENEKSSLSKLVVSE